MFDNIIGSVIFEFIGATIKWIILSILNLAKGKKIASFKKIYSGDKRNKPRSRHALHGGVLFSKPLSTEIIFWMLVDSSYMKPMPSINNRLRQC